MPKVTVDLSVHPKGEELELPPLGLVKNGETTEFSETQWAQALASNPPWAANIENDTLTLTDEAAAEVTEALNFEGDPEDLKKDELETLARAQGIETDGLTKAEIVEEMNNNA